HAATGPVSSRDVDVIRARLLEREPDKFAASLDARPVVELVGHFTSPSSGPLVSPPSGRAFGASAFSPFGGLRLRPHPVGGLDEAAGVIEQFAVGRMARALDRLDVGPDRRMLSRQILGEFVLLLRRALDQNGARVG